MGLEIGESEVSEARPRELDQACEVSDLHEDGESPGRAQLHSASRETRKVDMLFIFEKVESLRPRRSKKGQPRLLEEIRHRAFDHGIGSNPEERFPEFRAAAGREHLDFQGE